jgi:hypothetical protein
MFIAKPAADTLGVDGTYFDPIWRVRVTLTPLERELIDQWWIRRLAFVSHAGASATTTTQSYSRLEHSLGVFALAAHFRPDDVVARAGALVHDIGHPPLSHTVDRIAGLDHHVLGEVRIRELKGLFAQHDVDVADVLATVDGGVPSTLKPGGGLLSLDHLDSFVRSSQSHGSTEFLPQETLARLRLSRGAIECDAESADYLVRLVVSEAQRHCSSVNSSANAVVRFLVEEVIRTRPDIIPNELAAMTDDELLTLLLTDPHTGPVARDFRRNPAAWTTTMMAEPSNDDPAPNAQVVRDPTNAVGWLPPELSVTLERLYLDLPLVDGDRFTPRNDGYASLRQLSLPLQFAVRRDGAVAG